MRTIEELVTIEQQYIEERISGIENINFGEILQEENLTVEEFQYKKGELYLKTFNPTVLLVQIEVTENPQTFESTRAIQKKNTFLCAIPTRKMVWYSVDGGFNKDYCIENDILYKYRPYNGGALCVLPTDLEVSIIAHNAPTSFPQVILDKLVNWLKSKITNEIVISGNDILIDDRKILGMANYTYEGAFICGFHLAFDIDLDFIQQVCNKEIVKVPIGLNNFGTFNREELIAEMITWLK